MIKTALGSLLMLVALLVVAATGAGAHSQAPEAGYPRSMLVLGHSGLTGFGSNPKHPFQDARENSWAAGTNPAVNSIYSRLLAVDPAIRGHAANFGQDGATLQEFDNEVSRAIGLTTQPDLLIVDIGNNDIKCDGQDESRLASFGAGFASALQRLAAGLPDARIFVVGQAYNYDWFVKAMMQLSAGARLTHASKGICSIFAPQSDPAPGSVVPTHLSYVKRIMHAIDEQLAAACAQAPHCVFDGDASRHLNGTTANLTSRYDHLSVIGLAKIAALEWAAMRRLQVVGG
jgi:lysophospholipase L1-like esterase